MNLLPIKTIFHEEKRQIQVQGKFGNVQGILHALSGVKFSGYEIHMGRTNRYGGTPLLDLDGGAQSNNVYGSYIHGIFDEPEVVKGFLQGVLKSKGYSIDSISVKDWRAYKEEQYDKLADIIRASVDMKEIYKILEEG